MKIEIELTADQAMAVRRAFLPANPNKLRTKNVKQPSGDYAAPQIDGSTLIELAWKVIIALEHPTE